MRSLMFIKFKILSCSSLINQSFKLLTIQKVLKAPKKWAWKTRLFKKHLKFLKVKEMKSLTAWWHKILEITTLATPNLFRICLLHSTHIILKRESPRKRILIRLIKLQISSRGPKMNIRKLLMGMSHHQARQKSITANFLKIHLL